MEISHFLYTILIVSCLFNKTVSARATINKISANNNSKDVASWTILTYIAADNNLAPYASYNISDMSAGLASSNGINLLVQWDKPTDRKTWRYKIIPGGKVEVGSLQSEMGYNPEVELVNGMQWAINNYPAKNYALILWDHGSGIEDFYPGIKRTGIDSSWLQLVPSLTQSRGILYDDTQQTCLTNQGLTNALIKIKKLLGKNLDLIAMDACLMAMVEVAYQMQGLVNLFVGAQQTIPGNGFPYSQFIRPLSRNAATTSPSLLTQNMVTAYGNYYTKQLPTPDFTLSTIDVTSINMIKQNVDQFVNAVAACRQVDATQTKKIILSARKMAISFDMPEYVDIYSFYANILKQTKKSSPKSHIILEKRNEKKKITPSKEYQATLNNLNAIVQDGLNKITTIVLQKVSGPVYAGAKGLSIYYPQSGTIDPSYHQTMFAKNTAWTKFIQTYK